MLHLCGRSPVWILMWRWSFPLCSKARPQTSHCNRFQVRKMQISFKFKNYFVGPFLGVDSSVNLQVLLNAEHFMTKFALERSFSRMRAIMSNLLSDKDM